MSDQSMTDPEREVDPHDLDVEVVEDLDVDDDADGVEGGTIMNTGGCPSIGCPVN